MGSWLINLISDDPRKHEQNSLLEKVPSYGRMGAAIVAVMACVLLQR